MGTQPPPHKGVEPPPQFSAHFYCGQTAGCIKMPLGMDVGLSPEDFVLDGDPVPSPKRGWSPQIFGPCLLWPNGWMDQDATWYEVGLIPGDCVRWGPSSPPHEGGGAPSPIFGPCLLWPNGWMDEDAARYGSKPQPRPHCTRRSPSSHERGTAAPPLFSAHVYCGHGRPSQLLLSSCVCSCSPARVAL